MNSLLSLFTFILLTTSYCIQAQELSISLDQTIIPSPDAHGYAPVFKINSDSISHRGNGGLVIYPENFIAADTGYFFMYFTGCPNGIFSKEHAVLTVNYKSDSPTFWIDQNNNLDFTDDGPPTETSIDGDAILTFQNCENPQATFDVRLYRATLDSADISRIESHFGKPGIKSNGTELEEVKYWFADQRMNIKLYRGDVDGHEVSIGLYDSDCDGVFNRNQEDRVVIAQNTQDIPSTRPIGGAALLSDTTFVFLDHEPYIVTEIDPAGNYIVLEKSDEEIAPPLRLGDVIKNYVFLIGEDTISLAEARGDKDFLLIDVWGTWCAGCIQQTPFLKSIYEEYRDRLNILGLDKGDSMEKMKAHIAEHDIIWPNTYLTSEFEESLNIEGYPTYILIDKEGQILEYTNHIFNVVGHLDE